MGRRIILKKKNPMYRFAHDYTSTLGKFSRILEIIHYFFPSLTDRLFRPISPFPLFKILTNCCKPQQLVSFFHSREIQTLRTMNCGEFLLTSFIGNNFVRFLKFRDDHNFVRDGKINIFEGSSIITIKFSRLKELNFAPFRS